ncbi:8580_t:CDS:2 [Gigaspora rosea]|nr:8580_t:CDS:2 [Gigaspora rosea]
MPKQQQQKKMSPNHQAKTTKKNRAQIINAKIVLQGAIPKGPTTKLHKKKKKVITCRFQDSEITTPTTQLYRKEERKLNKKKRKKPPNPPERRRQRRVLQDTIPKGPTTKLHEKKKKVITR